MATSPPTARGAARSPTHDPGPATPRPTATPPPRHATSRHANGPAEGPPAHGPAHGPARGPTHSRRVITSSLAAALLIITLLASTTGSADAKPTKMNGRARAVKSDVKYVKCQVGSV